MHLSQLLTVRDVEKRALSILPSPTVGYYWSGADEERTLKENVNAFERFLILPRCLVNVSNINTSIRLFGGGFSSPLAFAPSAMHRLAHEDGEIATAVCVFRYLFDSLLQELVFFNLSQKAAASKKILMILSTLSTTSLEEVASAGGPGALQWFQLYVYKNRELTISLIRRVEKAGYRALVLTVDAPFFGRRLADCRSRFSLPPHLKLGNFEGLAQAKFESDKGNESGLFTYIMQQFDQTLTWEAVDWLRSITDLPIIVKGVLTKEDAETALSHGVSGIIVSNHGARQVDTVPNSIEALPGIVKAVAGRCPVMVDGGVRTGTDILKAVALGANMVFIGRPVLFGLAVGGFEGLCHIVDILQGELERAMALSGCSDVSNVPRSLVIHRRRFTAQL